MSELIKISKLMVTKDMMKLIEKYRKDTNCNSRSEAIRRLIELGLKKDVRN